MNAPTLQFFRGDDPVAEPWPVRGVAWVLAWSAVLTVLAASAMILTAFAYQLSAEQVLGRAAVAGLREAALPRATSHSVEAVVRNRLAGRYDLQRATVFELQQNGLRVKGMIRPESGDQLSVTLSAPSHAALPHWLGALVPGDDRAEIVTRIDRQFGL